MPHSHENFRSVIAEKVYHIIQILRHEDHPESFNRISRLGQGIAAAAEEAFRLKCEAEESKNEWPAFLVIIPRRIAQDSPEEA